MAPRRIQPGWRFSLAQALLRLLFGWKTYTISPWKKSGVAVCVVLVRNNRVLLALRAGNIEHAGSWSNIGGFVELETEESFAQGAVREFYEETGLRLPIEQFPTTPDMAFISHNQPKLSEVNATSTVGYYVFAVNEDLTTRLSPQEETADFKWFTEEQVKDMIETGDIPANFTDLHEALAEVFLRLKKGAEFRPLVLPRS